MKNFNQYYLFFLYIFQYYDISLCKCLSYLKIHTLYDGVGVFASVSYSAGEIIAYEPMISIHTNFTSQSMIDFYATAIYENPNHDILIYGSSLIYNHNMEPNVRIIPAEIPLDGPNDLRRFVVLAIKDIPKDTEMFISYGTELWFEHRNLTMLTPTTQTIKKTKEMKVLPGCVRSSIIFSNGNLITTEKIKKGEIIEINRALVIPGVTSIGSDLEEYVWFREGYHRLAGSLLILGNGGLINSPASGNVDDANVGYSWYHPISSTGNLFNDDDNDNDDNHMLKEKYPQVTCSLSMLIQFTALRDIESNEILSVALTRDSTPFTVTKDESELKRPKPRKYRINVRRKLIIDKYLPGECF